jgi:mono/diheme cytochrome c family protein
MRRLAWLVLPVIIATAGVWPSRPARLAAQEAALGGDVKRGEYMLYAGGCIACHTDAKNGGKRLAGGRALPTEFGTFYSPNITPDTETGIGGWTLEQFVVAMTEGRSPEGHLYYPAFPYTSYTRMSRQDLADLKAYLDSVPPVGNPAKPHELSFPYSLRPLLAGWRLLFFEPGAFQPDPSRPDSWNRGAYLVQGPGHCGECHTPRNMLGGPDNEQQLAGTLSGPEGKKVPNITPHADGIEAWSASDISYMLQTGILPDGDAAGGAMVDVIEDNTSHLTNEDRKAIAEYLLSLPPLPGPATPAAGS